MLQQRNKETSMPSKMGLTRGPRLIGIGKTGHEDEHINFGANNVENLESDVPVFQVQLRKLKTNKSQSIKAMNDNRQYQPVTAI